MSILTILGVLYYAILLFKQCNASPAELLDKLQHPDDHRIFRMILNMTIRQVVRNGAPEEAKSLNAAIGGPCRLFGTTVAASPGDDEAGMFWTACQTLTEAELTAMMEEVK